RGNCAAAHLDIAHGVARPQVFAFYTENAVIHVSGTASFASEQLEFTIDPGSKGFRIIPLRSPPYVRGAFKNPKAGEKAEPLIARGAVAAALATRVTPAAALLALISPSDGEANQCRTTLSQM
ncbi:AsmA family protein, partial [Escherichia coli]|nr:AsmA family protein [Escherichia coli]